METEEEFIEHLRMNSKEVNEESLKKAFMLLKSLKDDREALVLTGIMYLYGKGVERDIVSGISLLREAESQGSVQAIYALGLAAEEGRTLLGEPNFIEAFNYYLRASNDDYTLATYKLGDCYFFGMGVKKDLIKAFHYYQLTALKRLPLGVDKTIFCYSTGMGVSKNYERAYEYALLGQELRSNFAIRVLPHLKLLMKSKDPIKAD